MNPKTRYVAGFIGRTNLIEARWNNGTVECAGFNIPAEQIGVPSNIAGTATLSIRPQGIQLHRSNQDLGQKLLLPAKVCGRSYLGESWDYSVMIQGQQSLLQVAAPPFDVHAVGDPVWLEFDSRQIAVVN
ncbi:MAG: transporter ATP-binding protein [Polaromonas sp.]|nr:transporter ATP-binding protein [Polaromonas sp.]